MKRKKLMRAKAFTLVELLVVISIMAMLLAILMPALQKTQESARKVVCSSNQKQVSAGFSLYCTANGGLLPPYMTTPVYEPNHTWFALISHYFSQTIKKVGNTEVAVLICPSRRAKYPKTLGTQPNMEGTFAAVDYGVNYGMNEGLINAVLPFSSSTVIRYPWSASPPNGYGGVTSAKYEEVRNPSQIFLAMDSAVYKTGEGYRVGPVIFAPYNYESKRENQKSTHPLDYDFDGDGLLDSNKAILEGKSSELPYAYNGSDHKRHGSGPVVIFVDGHVRQVRTADWIEKDHWAWK
ncbi:MAG: type II secretion system GspH family protein [Planctomycetaceae bacterium]|nr:type II secretion system GspH family protein [Planctomycetaceae bacterium]